MHVLTFDPAGTVRTLYTELLDLGSIGPLEISRATFIEFRQATQKWQVKDTAGKVLFSNASRAVCMAWEQQHFNR
jgi:hypothetical protein